MSVRLDELEGAQARLAGMPATQPAISEAELQEMVLETAQILGWYRAHFRPAKTKHGWRTAVGGDGKGFPDVMLVRERLVAVELKATGRYPNADQRTWRERLERAGVEYHLWRPADWYAGTIEDVLR